MKNISGIIEKYGFSTKYIITVSVVLWFILMILIIVLFIKQHKLRKRYLLFMKGNDGKNLEKVILEELEKLENAKDKYSVVENRMLSIEENIKNIWQKVGMVKYDALNEMGGKMSFALALLSSNNDGMIINSVHSREGCYVYIKEVVDGKSSVELAEEEKKAMKQAIDG